MFDKMAKTIIKHPKAIIAIWLVVLLIAVPFAVQYRDVLNYDITTMVSTDSESHQGLAVIEDEFAETTSTGTIIVIEYDTADELSEIPNFINGSGGLSDQITDEYGTDTSLISLGSYNKNGDKTQSGVYLVAIQYGDNINGTSEVQNMRDIVSEAKINTGIDMTTYVTGTDAIEYDTENGATTDMEKIDPFSILLILILLGLFFYAIVTAVIPPAVVGMAYGIVLALVFFIGGFLDIFYITTTIVLVSMLGAGCDYSIFIVSRYKEERKNGKEKDDALTEAIKWAGESVATSGLAVIIGFGVMSLCSFSMIMSMGIILALGIVLAMIAALTFIPAVLALIGDKIFWPSKMESYGPEGRARKGVWGKFSSFGNKHFTKAARISKKHAIPIVIVALLVSAPAIYVIATQEDSFDMISVMPDSEGKEGIDTIIDYTDGGVIMPTYVVIQLDSSMANIDTTNHTLTWTSDATQYLTMTSTMSEGIKSNDTDNVDYVLGPTPWASIYSQVYAAVYEQVYEALVEVYGEGNVTPAMVEAYIAAHYGTEGINKLAVEQLPEVLQPYISQVFDTFGWGTAPATVAPYIDYIVNYVGGTVSTDGTYVCLTVILIDEPMSQKSMDSINAIDSLVHGTYDEEYSGLIEQTWVAGSVVSLGEISDTVNSQFDWIRVCVVILIFFLLMFVLGSYFTPMRSLLTIILGITWTLALTHIVFNIILGIDVTWVVPIVLFVVCLGLGMDYDILLTTRIKENKKKGMSNDDAIDEALVKSGSVITLCGLLMGGTFLTLMVSSSPLLQEFGFALGFAILVDSLIIIPYLVPALMHLMGDWSWKGPKFLQKNEKE